MLCQPTYWDKGKKTYTFYFIRQIKYTISFWHYKYQNEIVIFNKASVFPTDRRPVLNTFWVGSVSPTWFPPTPTWWEETKWGFVGVKYNLQDYMGR